MRSKVAMFRCVMCHAWEIHTRGRKARTLSLPQYHETDQVTVPLWQ
jgi:hypothetical protein